MPQAPRGPVQGPETVSANWARCCGLAAGPVTAANAQGHRHACCIAGEDAEAALKVTFKGLGGVKHLWNSGALQGIPGRGGELLGAHWQRGQRWAAPAAAAAAAAARLVG